MNKLGRNKTNWLLKQGCIFKDSTIIDPTRVEPSTEIWTDHNEYAKKVADLLKKNHIRAEADYTDDNMKNKIRKFKDYKDPYVVIIGDSEAENEQVSINIRGNKQLKNVPLDRFIEMCRTMNEEHSLDIIDTL